MGGVEIEPGVVKCVGVTVRGKGGSVGHIIIVV